MNTQILAEVLETLEEWMFVWEQTQEDVTGWYVCRGCGRADWQVKLEGGHSPECDAMAEVNYYREQLTVLMDARQTA